jgi:multimeric flavodoxin WrbA
MKCLAISGSRNPQGKTATMAQAFTRGATGAGCECETFFLPAMRIERCRQCDSLGRGDCFAKGSCVIEDDFAGLVDKIREADLVLFATPVYWGDLCESLRAFLDRLRRVSERAAHNAGIKGKAVAGVCVAGFDGGGAENCSASLEKVLRLTRLDVKDIVPVRLQNLELKSEVLEATGRWLCRQTGS